MSKNIFDHTSLLATILRRFCAGSVPSMSKRADNALDVGSLLAATSARAAPAMRPVSPSAGGTPTAIAPDGFGVLLRKMLVGF